MLHPNSLEQQPKIPPKYIIVLWGGCGCGWGGGFLFPKLITSVISLPSYTVASPCNSYIHVTVPVSKFLSDYIRDIVPFTGEFGSHFPNPFDLIVTLAKE